MSELVEQGRIKGEFNVSVKRCRCRLWRKEKTTLYWAKIVVLEGHTVRLLSVIEKKECAIVIPLDDVVEIDVCPRPQ